MDRERKFRGIDTTTKQWVYGGYHKHIARTVNPLGDKLKPEDIQHLIIKSGFSDWNMPKPIDLYEVVAESVGEITGLKDVNGKEIYELDILRCEQLEIIVEWDNDTAEFSFTDINDGSGLIASTCRICEVIGNSYENPELIK